MKRAALVPALALLASCGAPKATVVEEPEAPARQQEQVAADGEPAPPGNRDGGMLMPSDILTMPSEREMRPSVDDGAASAVIATPPAPAEDASDE